MALINLTGQEVTIIIGSRGVTLPPVGEGAWVTATIVECAPVEVPGLGWIPRAGFQEEIRDLPPFNGVDTFIVTRSVAKLAKRGDVVAPDIGYGSVVRDHNGAVKGVARLQCFD